MVGETGAELTDDGRSLFSSSSGSCHDRDVTWQEIGTDQYLNFSSHHPIEYKLSVYSENTF